MSYMYGLRATGELTSLVLSLREELYVSDYNAIDWNAARNECAKEDLYYPHPWYQVFCYARCFRDLLHINPVILLFLPGMQYSICANLQNWNAALSMLCHMGNGCSRS